MITKWTRYSNRHVWLLLATRLNQTSQIMANRGILNKRIWLDNNLIRTIGNALLQRFAKAWSASSKERGCGDWCNTYCTKPRSKPDHCSANAR
jgi:hypothetical protein